MCRKRVVLSETRNERHRHARDFDGIVALLPNHQGTPSKQQHRQRLMIANQEAHQTDKS